jgi:ABC-2 type transport system permease protein/sodium transport system permease protein
MTDFQPSGPRTLAERLARFFRLVQKELRENLRDRRTIITLVLMPVLLYPLLGVASRQFFLAAGKTLEQQPFRIVAENESAALLIGELLRESGKLTGVRPDQPAPPPRPGEPPLRPDPSLNFSSDVADVAASVGLGIDVAVLLREAPSGPLDVSGARDAALDVQLVFDPASPMSVEAANWLEDALLSAGARILDRRLRQLRVSQRPLPVVVLRRPLEAKERNTTSPLLVLAPLVLVLMTITGAVYPAIDLTAGERERGTLEVLCAAPAGRMSLLGAKYVTVVTRPASPRP